MEADKTDSQKEGPETETMTSRAVSARERELTPIETKMNAAVLSGFILPLLMILHRGI